MTRTDRRTNPNELANGTHARQNDHGTTTTTMSNIAGIAGEEQLSTTRDERRNESSRVSTKLTPPSFTTLRDAPLVGSGRSKGLLVLGHTTITKMLQTIFWRGPGSAAEKMGAKNWMQVQKKLEDIPRYRIMSAAQLNEAEYAGPLAAALFFLALKGSNDTLTSVGSVLAVAGQVLYYWPRWLFANEKNFNNGFPFYIPGAVLRYSSLILLLIAVSVEVL